MIRPMQNEDENRAEQIWYHESVLVHNWMDRPEEFWNNRRQDFRSALEKSCQKFVFVEDAVVVGFVLKWPNGYIPELFVDRRYRLDSRGNSRQIGRALIDCLKVSNSALRASVYMLNRNGVKFYIKNDFVITRLYVEEGTGFAKLGVEWEANKDRLGDLASVGHT